VERPPGLGSFVAPGRVSGRAGATFDQDLTIQEQALRVAGFDVIRAETASGAHRTGRAELETLSVSCVRVTRSSSLGSVDSARSIKDRQDIVYDSKARVALKSTEQPIDTRSAAGKAFLDMLEHRPRFGLPGTRGRLVARSGYRSVPTEALVALRRRLDTLPARHPDRTTMSTKPPRSMV
jgi:hypothetical protein